MLTENFRPGAMASLGLGVAELHGDQSAADLLQHHRLRQPGPLAERGGFDLILQAFCGLISVTGEPGRPA